MNNNNNHNNHTRSKVKGIEQLAEVLASVRAEGRKVVHCHGVFDLLHVGHIRHFEKAKEMGDVLVVTTTPDKFVNKGPGRPVFNQDLRAEAIAALDCVDHVAINQWPMATETIRLLRPDFYVKGMEYQDADQDRTGGIVQEEQAVESIGGKLVFTDDIVFSSSNLINQHLDVLSPETREYLAGFTERYSSGDILKYLESARSLKVLVVGETIIDEYQYCQQIGMSAKEPILAVQYVSEDKFAGGILAVANHVASFCENVSMLTFLGRQDSHEDMIRKHLRDNVEPIFLYRENSPTIVKRRLVEAYLLQKLFEIYVMGDQTASESEDRDLCARLEQVLPEYDLVIVADYGHGMLTSDAIDLLCKKARFLAVNTQANAGNRGFNTISKYPKADFVCLTSMEIALEERSRQATVRDMILSVSHKLNCAQLVVTQGKNGNTVYRETEGFFEVPALASQVVDTMGAGDSVFSIASLLVVQGAPMEMVGLVGNAVGAEAVATLGHERFIDQVSLYRHIETLLK